MRVAVTLDIVPFTVPNAVYLEKPMSPDNKIPLTELDSKTLDRLCDEFRNGVFRVAGAEQPPRQALTCDRCGERVS